MNLQALKGIINNALSTWQRFKVYQKATLTISALLLISFFVLFFSQKTSGSTLLFTDRTLEKDFNEITHYLDTFKINYTLNHEKMPVIPTKTVSKVRMDLAALGLPRTESNQGYELFDSSIKLDQKEQLVFQLRTLQAQLENDITQYDNIRSANVIIDIAPVHESETFAYRNKAYIVLGLTPGSKLSPSQSKAITYHVSGAVKSLAPNMIAIADTTGKVYQNITPDRKVSKSALEEFSIEESLKEKIDGILSLIVGPDNYYSAVQALVKSPINQSSKIDSISVNVLINKNIDALKFESANSDAYNVLKSEIATHLKKLLKGYQANISQTIEFVPFEQISVTAAQESTVNYSLLTWMVMLAFLAMVGAAIYQLARAPKPITAPSGNYEKPTPALQSENVDFHTMIELIQNRIKSDPNTFVKTFREWMSLQDNRLA